VLDILKVGFFIQELRTNLDITDCWWNNDEASEYKKF